MKLTASVIAVCLNLLGASRAGAQLGSDSLTLKESVSNLRQLYLSEIGDNAQIYHGSDYIRNGQKANGFPYYETEAMLNGSIYYQGNVYTNRFFSYDLVSDEIIIDNFDHDARMTLASEKIDSFSTARHLFLFLYATPVNTLNKSGFYERLTNGEPGLFVKREKKLDQGSGSQEARYIQYNYYFVRTNGIFRTVESKNSLIDLFGDKEDDIKKFIRSNKLNFKKDFENALMQTTNYYSGLKN